ncbi:PLP-dependent aminotransferase family protein [Aureibacillus halotolerans]|nr:PLP-dependent aminotransferase family protein [Aureibacillus halotolerans]
MKYGFAQRVRFMQSSAVRDILKVVNKGDVISFAGGLPDEDLFPVAAMKQAFQKTFEASDNKAMQYGETEGYAPLREQLSEKLQKKGIHRPSDNVLVTSGSQQAIDLFARVMFNPGDIVLTENPTYLAALQVFESYEVRVVPVLSDDNGMDPEDLEQKMKKLKPKCVYVVPTFSNPGGKVWSFERRKLLLELAQKHQVVIFEDDPYGDIQFNSEEVYTPIASLDKENKYVLYTSTFSKTVVPAMRLGWIVGPHQIIRMMAQAKQATDLHTNSLAQVAMHHLVNDFDLDAHVSTLCKAYKERMLVMKSLLDSVEMDGLTYVEPKGGMFFWVSLPSYVHTASLLPEAVEQGVAFVPGAPFYVSNAEENTMRLNFTHSKPELIHEGMRRLVNVINEKKEAAPQQV